MKRALYLLGTICLLTTGAVTAQAGTLSADRLALVQKSKACCAQAGGTWMATSAEIGACRNTKQTQPAYLACYNKAK